MVSLESFFDEVTPKFCIFKLQEAADAVQENLDSFLESTRSEKLELEEVVVDLFHAATVSADRAHLEILEFLFSDQIEAKSIKTMKKDRIISQEEFCPGSRGGTHVDVLLEARNRALASHRTVAMSWSEKEVASSTKSAKELKRKMEARILCHSMKSEEQQHLEAAEVAGFLTTMLPNRVNRSIIKFIGEYASKDFVDCDPNEEVKMTSDIQMLGDGIEERAHSYYHIVAPLLADFFYLNETETERIEEVGGRVQESARNWQETKQSFVDKLDKIQEKLYEVKGDKLHILDPLIAASTETTTRDRRYRRPSFVKFHTDFDGLFNGGSVESPPFMVFVDNLPIDIGEEEIGYLYSSCGQLDAVQVFNKRPDLDPGPLNSVQLKARRHGKLGSVKNFRKWERPRTPVYALLTFSDQEGFDNALVDPLRIFGMVIRRHPVRSRRATDVRTLYLEDLAEGTFCADLEFQLRQKLCPSLSVQLGEGHRPQSAVGSCSISFPSFDVALEMYEKVAGLSCVQSNESPVNWFRSPRDAEDWWTRRLGFD